MTQRRASTWLALACTISCAAPLRAQPQVEPPPPREQAGEPPPPPPPGGDPMDGRRPRNDRIRQGPGGPGNMGGPGMGQPGGPLVPDDELDARPTMFRELLVRFRERLDAAVSKLNEGVAALDRGEAPSKVRRELEPAGRDLRQALIMLGGADRGERGGGPDGMGPGSTGFEPGAGPMDGPPGNRRPGPDGVRGPMGGGRQPVLTDEARQRVRALIQEHRPQMLARIDELAKNDRRASDKIIATLAERLHELADVRERDPEMFGLRADELENTVSIMSVVGRIARAQRENAAADALKPMQDELRALVGEQFDIRLAMQRKQIADMKARADRMLQGLDKQAADRERAVSAKYDEVLRNAERGPKGPPQDGQPGQPGPARPPKPGP